MFKSLPTNATEIMDWSWSQFEPYYTDLAQRPLTDGSVEQWLADWTTIDQLGDELETRLNIATTVNTADEAAQQKYQNFLDTIFSPKRAANQVLKQKLVDSGLSPKGFEIPLRNLRGEAELFREANLPLLAEERKLSTDYDKIIGAQTIIWEGEEKPLSAMRPFLMSEDRNTREKAWKTVVQRRLQDREELDELWIKFLGVRQQIAQNAGLADYREYRWRELLRFDYTPDDCKQFHAAIEHVCVPVLQRVLERHRQRLGVETLRPWDVLGFGSPFRVPPLKPFSDVQELETKSQTIFSRVDPQLGGYFETMRREKWLDLDTRKNKAPGGYCTYLAAVKRPFIFMSAIGLHTDVETLLHEGGHAFHAFESSNLPYSQQLQVPMEFAEVASMAMELLASPYLAASQGGFYSDAEAARARIQHLEGAITFWPYMAVVDAYQHWVYENIDAAKDPRQCDAKWIELMKRFIPSVDFTGLEEAHMLLRIIQLHLFHVPFYYVEYGLAQLGAMQVWANSLKDQAGAVAAYRKALALGYTEPLPKLYETAGAKFTFDAKVLREMMELAERTIEELRPISA